MDEMPWLQVVQSQLTRYIEQQRVPQALLISGKKGLGKQQLAKNFAQSLLCFSPQANGLHCEKCRSCLLFNAQTHPDYLLIEPEETGKSIAVETIRQLQQKLILKPQFETYRIVLINPAEQLNLAAANAFLKYLEEPTERTCVILIAEKPEKLLATIRSRCQKLVLSTPDKKRLTEWLIQQGITENHDLLFNLSQGAPLLAKQLAETDLLTLRLHCFKHWLSIAHSEISVVIVAEQWCKLDKLKIELLLLWIISWVIDMIRLAYQKQPIRIDNLDFVTSLQTMVKQLELKKLYQYYDFLLHSQQKFESTQNKQLIFEEILIQWLTLNRG